MAKKLPPNSSRRNPAGRISRSAKADTLRGRGRAGRAAHPNRTHRARRKARYGRHRAAARQVLQDRRCVLDEHSGALRSRNGRRRARAADQEDCVLRGGVRAMQNRAYRLSCSLYFLIPDAACWCWPAVLRQPRRQSGYRIRSIRKTRVTIAAACISWRSGNRGRSLQN